VEWSWTSQDCRRCRDAAGETKAVAPVASVGSASGADLSGSGVSTRWHLGPSSWEQSCHAPRAPRAGGSVAPGTAPAKALLTVGFRGKWIQKSGFVLGWHLVLRGCGVFLWSQPVVSRGLSSTSPAGLAWWNGTRQRRPVVSRKSVQGKQVLRSEMV